MDFSGDWSDFSISETEMTVVLNLVSGLPFNGTVSRLALYPGGISGSPLDFTFDQLAAIPEPASRHLLLIGVAMLALLFFKRRCCVTKIKSVPTS